MANQDHSLAIAAFSEAAQEAYQTGSKLRSRVFEISGVVGKTQRFEVFGTTDAEERLPSQDVAAANVGNATPTAALRERSRFDYVDRQNEVLTNIAIARHKGAICGKAVSRQIDADIIKALQAYDSSAYTRGPDESGTAFPTTGAGLTMNSATAEKLDADDLANAVSRLMNEMDEEDDELTLVYPALQFRHLADDVKLASMDYMQGTGSPGVTKTGRFQEIYGFTPIFVGQNARRGGKGALPVNRAYLFAKSAIGLATGTLERMGVMEWVSQKRSWLVGAEANCGATRINNGGVLEINLKP